MEISEFMALSPKARMDFAPVIAKYNPASTSAFETIINIINRCGFDALNIHFKMGFLLNLASVPNSEINKQPTTMGILKDAIRKVLTEEAQRTGRDIRFIDTPTQVIETAKQAKQHDMELVEKPRKRKYGAIVYEHNPYADHEKSLLFLYVLDQLKNKSVGYIAFTDYDITVCRGCPFGQYNMWSKTNSAKTSFGLNSQSLKEATEYFERIFADERYQFIITKKGKARANEILKIQVKKGGNNG